MTKQLTLAMCVLALLGPVAAAEDKVDDTPRDWSKVTAPGDFKTYDGAGYSIKHPADWTVQSQGGGVLIQSKDQLAALNIQVVDVPNEEMLKAVAIESRKRLEAGTKDIKFEVFAPATVPAGNAYFMQYQGKFSGLALTVKQVLVAKGSKIYVLSMTATPEKAKAIEDVPQQMFASLTAVAPATNKAP